MVERTLRIGILSDGPVLQRWQADAIRQVLAVPGVWPVLLVTNGLGGRHRSPLRTFLYRTYRRRFFRPPAMDPVDMRDELAHIPRLVVTPLVDAPVHHFSAPDLAHMRAARPDVLLRFGFNILRGEILDLPRHGVWSFHHGDEKYFRGGPPGFWEIMRGEPITGAILQRLTDRLDAGIVLRKGWFRTVDHSLQETVDTVLAASASWPAQVCLALLSGDADAATGAPSTTDAPVYRYPGNFNFLRFLWLQARNKIRFHRTELNVHEEWNIGVLPQPIQSLLQDEPNLNVRWLPPPATGSYRADPFGYLGPDGQINVLYEKYDQASGIGSIHRVRPKPDNLLKRSRPMLTTGGHLSYPYVLEHEGSLYCVPEQVAEGRVTLYRMNGTNEGLEEVATLLNAPLFDPTLFQHDGRWWLFGTVPPNSNVTLMAYWADQLTGPYHRHALDPVKQDIRSARPAGTPFLHEGTLFRPAQDCSEAYGRRIAINAVRVLTPTSFREDVVKFVGPLKGPYPAGIHTLCAVGGITLVDGKRLVNSSDAKERVHRRKVARIRSRVLPEPSN